MSIRKVSEKVCNRLPALVRLAMITHPHDVPSALDKIYIPYIYIIEIMEYISKMSRSALLSKMVEAAHAAGERLRLDFSDIAALEVKHKGGPGDPFTIADLRAEETIRTILTSAYPEYGFLGEEGGFSEIGRASCRERVLVAV